MRRAALLAGLLGVASLNAAPAARVLQIPLEDNLGFKREVIIEPDGTKVEWTEFFKSADSGFAIGRSTINGPLLPASNLDYTDCFYVARGSSTVIVEGRTYTVSAGDFVLLPRCARVEGHDFRHYVHFAASFETRPDARSNGPLELRRLRPDRLKDADFTIEGTNMRHIYYQGDGGVVVRAWQSTEQDMSTDLFTSPWSELSFIISGRGTITNEDGSAKSIKAGDAIFIAKGQRLKVSTHRMRKLAIVFDQTPVETAAQ